MPTENKAEEIRFRELIARVKGLGERDSFLVSRAELRLICRRGPEFWAAVEERKPNTPADTSGPSEYM